MRSSARLTAFERLEAFGIALVAMSFPVLTLAGLI